MGKIDLTVAKEMVNNYAETRKKLIDNAYGINDTQSIWFTVDEVKQFVANLSPQASGVRIYLGVYNGDYAYTPDQTCVIAIETTKDSSSGKDLDPIQQDSGETAQKRALDSGGSPAPFNQGKICPPAC